MLPRSSMLRLRMYRQDISENIQCLHVVTQHLIINVSMLAFVEANFRSLFSFRVRELSTSKVGTLLRISGQVVRTHPVHPELTSGNFLCLECQTTIPDIEQQFKFTEPTVCKNPLCQNRRRFMLQVNSSRFVDFQKVRVQETQQELPRGSIPRRCVHVCVCVCTHKVLHATIHSNISS